MACANICMCNGWDREVAHNFITPFFIESPVRGNYFSSRRYEELNNVSLQVLTSVPSNIHANWVSGVKNLSTPFRSIMQKLGKMHYAEKRKDSVQLLNLLANVG
jgi:hypothetical protein